MMTMTAVRVGSLRLATLPVGAAMSVLTARLLIGELGVEQFGVITLVSTLPILLSFADLGIGTAVVNAVARRGLDNTQTPESIVGGAARLLIGVAAVLFVASVLATAVLPWHGVMGINARELPNLQREMFLLLVIFCATLPLGLGARALTGAGQQHWVVAGQGTIPVVSYLVTLASIRSSWLTGAMIAPVLSQAFAGMLLSAIAARTIGLDLAVVRGTIKRRLGRAQKRSIFSVARPMFVVMVGLPLAFNTDRILLSHVGDRASLASYAAAMVLYAPIWSVLTAAGLTLWPRFAQIRSEIAQYRRSYLGALAFFALGGTCAAICLFALGPAITELWADAAAVPRGVWLALGLLLLVQASHLPAGMALTDRSGLRFQAGCVVLMAFSNVALSAALIPSLGAAGPVVGSVASVFPFQLVPGFIYIMRGQRVGDMVATADGR